jgi:hypothetical protein
MTSGAWKIVGLLVLVAAVSFVLGFYVVSRFVG